MVIRVPLALLSLLGAPAAVGSPAAHLAALRPAAGQGTDPFALLVPAAGLLAWAIALWLATVTVAVGMQRVPGTVGRAARATQARLAPAVVCRAVAVALGVAVLAGATPATADGGRGTSEAPVSLDWPVAAAAPAAADVATGAGTGAGTGASTASAPAAVVLVRPGDSLWRIAERHLGERASDREVAGAWPTWWSANRDVVGPDPDLLRPGARLVPPA